MKRTAILFLLVPGLLGFSCTRLTKKDAFLTNLLQQDSAFEYIIRNKDSLEVQILYTQIDRDEQNRPQFTSYSFNLDSARYFYPASTIKLPIVMMALEKLQELSVHGIDRNTTVFHDSAYSGQRFIRTDATAETGKPSIGHYVRKVLMVSDNEASNALYEFLGQREANDRVRAKGYNIRVLHRLSRPLTAAENRHTEAIRFVRNDSVLYSQPMQINQDSIRINRTILSGIGYLEKDSLVRKPFDFSYKNSFPLQEQQEILKAILFPGMIKPEKRFNISEEDRKFVMQYMSQFPRETRYPPYQQDTSLYDASVKFLLFALDRKPIPESIRIFNKIGGAYGYLIDNAYVVDFDNGVEFLLSAVINTNRDGIYNDDHYDYTTIGYPFLRDLGQKIYRYELARTRQRKPDLSEFRLTYDR